MSHIIAKLTDVEFADVKRQLEADAARHAEQGMYLEHLWQNSDNPNDVVFMFRVDNLDNCKQFMEQAHAEAREHDPQANVPATLFLRGE
jgi:hypothetical protein